MNIANCTTCIRIILTPLIIYLLVTEKFQNALWFFLAAGLTDAIDGFLAKKFSLITKLGKYLDPLADKFLLISVFVVMGFIFHDVPSWLVILLIGRDIFIVFGSILLYKTIGPFDIRPTLLGKANTVAQILFAGILLLHKAFEFNLNITFFVFFVATTTIASWVSYIIIGTNLYRKHQS